MTAASEATEAASAATSAATTAASRSRIRRRSLTVSGDAAGGVGKPLVEDLRRRQKAGASEVLRVFEHQKEVQVTDQDPDQLHDSTPLDDQVEQEQNPRQIHRLVLKKGNRYYNFIYTVV